MEKKGVKMHIRHNAVSNNAKTEKQWNRLGYKIKENVEGVSAWSNAYCVVSAVYYEPYEVELMNEEDRIQYKAYLKEKRAIYEKERKRRQEHIKHMTEKRDNYGTACQWLNKGYVVKEHAKGIWGSLLQQEDEHYFSGDYIYYHIDDVENNPTKAKELADNFPHGHDYDGRAWWL